MRYRIYKGEEYFGRNLDYRDTLVLYCEEYGYVGTRNTVEEIEDLKKLFEYSILEAKHMKVYMVGTPTCTKCKELKPKIEDYCREHVIFFKYTNIQETDKEVLEIIVDRGITSAPVFVIYKDGINPPVVVSGDEVYLELT